MATHLTLSSYAFALFLALSLTSAGPAKACSPAPGSMPYETDPEAWPGDVTPPDAITDVSVETHPSYDSEGCDDCGGGPAGLILRVRSPADDQAPSQSLGYRVTLVEGRIDGLYPPLETDVEAVTHDGSAAILDFRWHDADGTRGLDALLRIQAVDPAGNVGPPFEVRVQMRSAESSDGCSAGRRSGGGQPLLLAGVLLFGLTRQRRRRGGPIAGSFLHGP